MKSKSQQKAIKQLRRNFFLEALKLELAKDYSRQHSESIKRGLARKKALTKN